MMRLAAFLGLTGPDGHLSFSKMVTLTVLALSYVTGTFGLGIAIAALSASFGVKAWLAFLQRNTFTASATTATTIDAAAVVKAIRERRDDTGGVDPAP